MEILLSIAAVVVKILSYVVITGTAIGICDSMRGVNRKRYYNSLVEYYVIFTKSLTGALISIGFRLLTVSGIAVAAGQTAAAVMIVIYCVEASLIMTIGQRQRRGVHG